MQRLIAWRKGPQLLSSDAFTEAVGSEAVSLKQLFVVQRPSVMVSNYTWRGLCVCGQHLGQSCCSWLIDVGCMAASIHL